MQEKNKSAAKKIKKQNNVQKQDANINVTNPVQERDGGEEQASDLALSERKETRDEEVVCSFACQSRH